MAIDQPKATGAAPAGRGPVALARWGDQGPQRSGGRQAQNFLVSRGMGRLGPHGASVGTAVQGKKVLRSRCGQASEAQPSFGEIKPARGRVARASNRLHGARPWRRQNAPRKTADQWSGEKETLAEKKAGFAPVRPLSTLRSHHQIADGRETRDNADIQSVTRCRDADEAECSIRSPARTRRRQRCGAASGTGPDDCPGAAIDWGGQHSPAPTKRAVPEPIS